MTYSKFFYHISIVLIFLSISNCKPNVKEAPKEEIIDAAPNLAVSIDGRLLKPWNDSPEFLVSQEAQGNTERTHYLQNTKSIEAHIIYANFLLKCGRVENAIKICDKGLQLSPNQPDLLVLRAESYLKGRQMQSAIDDCWDAGKALESKNMYMGLVKQTGNDSIFNATIGYKNYLTLAIAMQCKNDMDNSEKMYELLNDFCSNPDLYTKAYYYQYQCYSRHSKKAEAAEIIKGIEKTKPVLAPAKAYLQSLLFWKGEISESELVDINSIPSHHNEAEDWVVKTYAVAVKNLNNNQIEKAKIALNNILISGYWDYYPAILAEKDLSQLSGINYQDAEIINLNSTKKQAPGKTRN